MIRARGWRECGGTASEPSRHSCRTIVRLVDGCNLSPSRSFVRSAQLASTLGHALSFDVVAKPNRYAIEQMPVSFRQQIIACGTDRECLDTITTPLASAAGVTRRRAMGMPSAKRSSPRFGISRRSAHSSVKGRHEAGRPASSRRMHRARSAMPECTSIRMPTAVASSLMR